MTSYTKNITYLTCPGLFGLGNLEFSASSSSLPVPKIMPDSPIYERAKRIFSQSGYMYPAPPLFLGVRDILFPQDDIFVLRLLIKQPGSNFMLPKKLEFLAQAIKNCAAYQMEHFPDFANRFVYLTVRSGTVREGQKDDELHVDGFQGISVPRHIPEQNYLWASNNPTLFSLQPYFVENIDPSRHNIHNYFESNTNKSMLMSGVDKGLYAIDPYHIHARPSGVIARPRRSMFRLCFSPVEIRDDNNFVNKYLPRGPYGRSDIRDRLTTYEGSASDSLYGLRPATSYA